jgi:hypothetical protein
MGYGGTILILRLEASNNISVKMCDVINKQHLYEYSSFLRRSIRGKSSFVTVIWKEFVFFWNDLKRRISQAIATGSNFWGSENDLKRETRRFE